MAVKIYIDQGHNPVNPNAGAEGNGLREQDLVYRIGMETAELLRKNSNVEVRLSRPDLQTQLGSTNSTSLIARVNDANKWGADYFVSLHTNASEIASASGSEAFAYSLQSKGYELGESILYWLNQTTALRNRGTFARPGLYVLRKTNMPATLVELGFITNYNDSMLMNNYPGIFAQGVSYGILDYLNLL